MNTFLHHLTPKSLFTSAHVCSALCALCVFVGTHNYWLALAASFALLCLISAASAAVWVITEHQAEAVENAVPMDHRKLAMPEPRHATGDRYASGCTLLQMLAGIALFSGVLLFIPAVAFIVFTVMGAEEPKWQGPQPTAITANTLPR